jgi:hypothetical protein
VLRSWMVSYSKGLKNHSFLRLVACHPGDLEPYLTALLFISEVVSAQEMDGKLHYMS